MWGVEAIEKFIEHKIEEMGKELIGELIDATPLGAAIKASERFSSFVESGGKSEVERLISKAGIRPDMRGPEVLERLAEMSKHAPAHGRRKPRWMRGGWAKSRREWLDEGWRHDWRSQPRDLKGRWIPGRLDNPVMKKLPVSRRQKLIRRMRSKARRAGRSAARGIISSWGLNDGN